MTPSRALCRTFLFLALAAVPLAAVDGQFDSSFHGSGHTYTTNGDPGAAGAAAWALAPDDRLVYAQGLGVGLLWQATNDTTWSAPCSVTAPAGFGAIAIVDQIAFDASGRLVIAGLINSTLYPDFLPGFFVRFDYPACTLDTSFSVDGWAFLVGSPLDHFGFSSFALTGSGLYALGEQGPDSAVARLTDAGNLDPYFDSDGLWLSNYAGADVAAGGAVLGNSDLAVVGWATDAVAGQVAVVTQLSPTGVLRNTVVIDPRPGEADTAIAYRAARMGDGRLAVAITDTLAGVDAPVAAVLRQQGIGSILVLDASWNGDGVSRLDIGNDARVLAVTSQGDGKVLLGGMRLLGPGDHDALVIRLDRDGALDPAFNPILLVSHGFKVVSFPSTASDNVGTSIFLSRDGLPVLGGHTDDGYPGVARLTNAYAFADGFESGRRTSWSVTSP